MKYLILLAVLTIAGCGGVPMVQISPDNSSGVTVGPDENDRPDLYSELMKLDDLRNKGILTDEEFEAQKKKLLESDCDCTDSS